MKAYGKKWVDMKKNKTLPHGAQCRICKNISLYRADEERYDIKPHPAYKKRDTKRARQEWKRGL